MGIKLTILGYNAAVPSSRANPTSQVIEVDDNFYLLDCGEATQLQLRKAKIKFTKINTIFISHLHGDHVYGLIGLISTFELLGREKPLTIFGPKGIKEFISLQQNLTSSHRNIELIFHELSSTKSEKIFEDKKIEVFTIPLQHRIYTNGYLVKEKTKKRKLNQEEIIKYPEITICDYQNIKNGLDFTLSSGNIIPNNQLSFPPVKSKSYAFCSDTTYLESIIPIIENVDLLYHEATFKDDKKELAKITGHSTSIQAAEIAKKANVKKLVLGHFSNRYKNPRELVEEAQTIFPNTIFLEQLQEYKIE
ncbi:MAG: ribonuclease Z [Solirubrobacteraceae bacterium]